jgi:hypothetical protein
VKKSGELIVCSNSDATKCKYEQSTSSSLPKVTSIDKTDTTLVFTGENFLSTNFQASSSLDGVSADSVTVESPTKVTALWTKGVPALK